MLTDGLTHGRTDDGRKVITIAHPEQSSGELKSQGQPKVIIFSNFVGPIAPMLHTKLQGHLPFGSGEEDF